MMRTGQAWERIGARLWPRLAGVHLVEATKSLYAPIPLTETKRVGRTQAAQAALNRDNL